MNERIRELLTEAQVQANDLVPGDSDDRTIFAQRLHTSFEKFAELLLRNLSEELYDVAKQSKKANREWADGVDHAAMLAQRMLMDLPQWPDTE